MLTIGVHFPKASGTSLLRAMQRHFGDAVFADYGDGPTFPDGQRQLDPVAYMKRRDEAPPNTRVVFGHFHPAKYQHVSAQRFTMLRHPIDTLISIYFFWRSSPISSGLHRYVVENDLSVEQMACIPSLQRLMSRSYFEGVDMATFDVIGCYEQRDISIARIRSLLDIPAFDDRERVGASSPERDAMCSDTGLRRRLEDALHEDIAFYERCVR